MSNTVIDQVAQSFRFVTIADSGQHQGERPAPVSHNPSSYNSLNTAPIDKLVDFFDLNRGLGSDFKSSSPTESSTVRAAIANIASLRTRVDYYKKECDEYKGKFNNLVALLERGNIVCWRLRNADPQY